MPAFNDYISGFAPETGWPSETFSTDITAAHDADMAGANETIVRLEGELAQAQQALKDEQVINYQLMRAGMATSEEEAPADEQEEEPSADPQNTDDLYKEDEDN